MSETNNEKKIIRVLDGGSHGGVERGLVYYCHGYSSHPDEPSVLRLTGVLRIEAVSDDMDFHTDLIEPADFTVTTDEQIHIETTTLTDIS